ncbi:MAG TPA: ABC transporter permease [Ignavibacteriaceae bacterium]|nr:ABC transporter permease [Ignavibacteriaceae bacterium]
MFLSYLKIALRSLKKNKLYSSINIIGLVVGITITLFLFLWVSNELSYDKFNNKSNRTYRALWNGKFGNNEWTVPLVGIPLQKTLEDNFPDVENVTSFTKLDLFIGKQNPVKQENIYFVDNNFFDVFNIKFLSGDPNTAIAEPNSIVLTKETAEKYFSTTNVLGKTLTSNNGTIFKVTGVVEKFPSQSHFHFKAISSLKGLNFYKQREDKWGFASVYTYLVLQKGANPNSLKTKLRTYLDKNVFSDMYKNNGDYSYFSFQPVEGIHLTSDLKYELEPSGNKSYVYIFSTIAFFILLLATINFANMSTAFSFERLNEIGVRKVFGSLKKQIIIQFLVETLVQVVIAFGIAIVLLEILMPVFNNFAHSELSLRIINNPSQLLAIVSIGLFITILSGAYPAFYVSGFSPIDIMKNKISAKPHKKYFRKSLVGVQFVISSAIIAATFIVSKQIGFVLNDDLGFNKEHVLIIKNTRLLSNHFNSFRDELLSDPAIADASGVQALPGDNFDSTIFELEQPANLKQSSITYDYVDEHFVDVLKLNIVSGRNFSTKYKTDSTAYLINQAAAKAFGWKDPIGKSITGNYKGKVVGVVQDFNYQSLHHKIQPIIFPFSKWTPGLIAVRLKPGKDLPGIVSKIKEKWGSFVNNRPMEFSFLDQDYDKLYKNELQMADIFNLFAMLASFIAGLGLLGITNLIVKQRKKEIGIRKILGASVSDLFSLLNREFILIILLANIIAIPVVIYYMNSWLQDFAYRITIDAWTFAIALVSTLLLAVITISTQVFKAAKTNPVTTLKDE